MKNKSNERFEKYWNEYKWNYCYEYEEHMKNAWQAAWDAACEEIGKQRCSTCKWFDERGVCLHSVGCRFLQTKAV